MLVQCEHNGVNRNCNRRAECPSLPAVYVALQLLGFGGKDAHVYPFLISTQNLNYSYWIIGDFQSPQYLCSLNSCKDLQKNLLHSSFLPI